MKQAVIGLALGAIATAAFFYGRWGLVPLLWCIAVVIVCVLRFLAANRVVRQPPETASVSDVVELCVWSVFIAAVASSFPIWVTMTAGGFEFAYMMTLALGIFWSSSFIHAPVLPVAVAFMMSQLVIGFAAAFLAGLDWTRFGIACLFAVGVATALQVVRQLSETFRLSILQQMELEQKSEVIRDLLKDHEDQSSDWLWQTDRNLRIVDPSDRFREAVVAAGLDPAGRSLRDLFLDRSAEGTAEALAVVCAHLEARHSFRDVTVPFETGADRFWFTVSGRPVLDRQGEFAGFRGVMSDVTAARRAEIEVAYLSRHDALTGLANRAELVERMDRILSSKRSFALISIDLEGLKSINEIYDQANGDALLIEIAKRMSAEVKDGDLVARVGGDEFAICTSDTDAEKVRRVCHRLAQVMAQPLPGKPAEMIVGSTMGVAFAPRDGSTAGEILRNADTALGRAKNDDRGSVRFFAADLDSLLLEQHKFLHDLRSAVQKGELSVHYQPLIDARNGTIQGCEALLRWFHPVRGMVSPAEFVPVAEESGLIGTIGKFVLESACREAVSWPDGKQVSINVSPVQFRDRDLPRQIFAALNETGLPAERLIVEVTESILVDDVELAVETLCKIRGFGVRIALDDFGTGYSSLSYLQLFPFDKIKIDRAFIDRIEARPQNQVIVRAIRDIADGFGMTITAEGVETQEQAALLREIGCDEFQGYLFSRPVAATDLRPVLDSRFAA